MEIEVGNSVCGVVPPGQAVAPFHSLRLRIEPCGHLVFHDRMLDVRPVGLRATSSRYIYEHAEQDEQLDSVRYLHQSLLSN